MEREHVDIVEVFLKKDLDIPLTEVEEKQFNSMDDDARQTLFELVNNSSYIEELVRLINKINNDSSSLPIEEHQIIQEKCDRKKQKLENSSSYNLRKTI